MAERRAPPRRGARRNRTCACLLRSTVVTVPARPGCAEVDPPGPRPTPGGLGRLWVFRWEPVRDPVVVFTVVGVVPAPAPCECPAMFADLLADWSCSLERLLASSLCGGGRRSVLVHAGCSRGCGVRALLALRVAAYGTAAPVSWSVLPAPGIPRVPLGGLSVSAAVEPGLRLAAAVDLTDVRLSLRTASPPPVIRRLFAPPLGVWREFAVLAGADRFAATEIFSSLVADGMPVCDALLAAPALAA